MDAKQELLERLKQAQEVQQNTVNQGSVQSKAVQVDRGKTVEVNPKGATTKGNENNMEKRVNGFFEKVRKFLEWIIECVKKFLLWLIKLLIDIYNFFTTPPGSAIPLGLMTLYFVMLSGESYWQTIPAMYDKPSFIPKFLIDDGASLSNFSFAASDPAFWVALVASTVIQVLQAMIIREMAIEALKRMHSEAAKHTVPDEPKPNNLEIVGYYQKRIKRHGMTQLKLRGVLIWSSYIFDGLMQIINFPLIGISPGLILINLFWLFLSVVGTEAFLNLTMESLKGFKSPKEAV